MFEVKSKKAKINATLNKYEAILNYLFEIKQKVDYLCHIQTLQEKAFQSEKPFLAEEPESNEEDNGEDQPSTSSNSYMVQNCSNTTSVFSKTNNAFQGQNSSQQQQFQFQYNSTDMTTSSKNTLTTANTQNPNYFLLAKKANSLIQNGSISKGHNQTRNVNVQGQNQQGLPQLSGSHSTYTFSASNSQQASVSGFHQGFYRTDGGDVKMY